MLRRLCLHVRANKLHQREKGIWIPILYHELQKGGTVLMQGWVENTWHLWCETVPGGEVSDPQVALLEMDDIKFSELVYTREKPPEPEEDLDIVGLWEVYQRDPHEFWKQQHPRVRDFKSKILALSKSGRFP